MVCNELLPILHIIHYLHYIVYDQLPWFFRVAFGFRKGNFCYIMKREYLSLARALMVWNMRERLENLGWWLIASSS